VLRSILYISNTEHQSFVKETVAAIIRESKILHVAFVDEDEMPQCMPMIGALEENEQGDHILYLHGRCTANPFMESYPLIFIHARL